MSTQEQLAIREMRDAEFIAKLKAKKPRMTPKVIAEMKGIAHDEGYRMGYEDAHQEAALPTLFAGAVVGAFMLWALPHAWQWVTGLFH